MTVSLPGAYSWVIETQGKRLNGGGWPMCPGLIGLCVNSTYVYILIVNLKKCIIQDTFP